MNINYLFKIINSKINVGISEFLLCSFIVHSSLTWRRIDSLTIEIENELLHIIQAEDSATGKSKHFAY